MEDQEHETHMKPVKAHILMQTNHNYAIITMYRNNIKRGVSIMMKDTLSIYKSNTLLQEVLLFELQKRCRSITGSPSKRGSEVC